MSKQSGFYANPKYYDILFDWDRKAEVDFIDACLKKYGVNSTEEIAEIACGTGLVAIPLADKGWKINCIDFSEDMLAYLNNKINLNKAKSQEIKTLCADMRNYSLDHKVSASFCTIGSIGLLETDEDLINHLQAVHKNTSQNGIYLIDLGIVDGETIKSPYEDIIWSNQRDGITVEAEGGRVYVLENGCEEKEFEWEAVPYEYNPKHFSEVVKRSKCFEIEAWHEESELDDDGISYFDLNKTVEKPTNRSMVVLRAI
jgi:SAM-dependent methyltransferase